MVRRLVDGGPIKVTSIIARVRGLEFVHSPRADDKNIALVGLRHAWVRLKAEVERE